MLFTSKDQEQPKDNRPFEAQAINQLGPVKSTKNQRGMLVFLYIITFSIYYWVIHISKMNQLNAMQTKINESASGIEIQLQKRFDTLNKLVDSVKNQVQFNKDIYENLAKYRSNYNDNNLTLKNETLNKISTGLSMAFENYPSLGADSSITKLMNESTMIEKEIAAARRLYNADVTLFNTTIYNFPMCAVVDKKGYHGLNLFKSNEIVKNDVKINFY